MYIQLYRKLDLLLLLRLGQDELNAQAQIKQLIEALKQINDEKKVIKIQNGYLSYSVSKDSIVVICDTKPQDQLVPKVEEFVLINLGARVGGASKELQLNSYDEQLSELVSKHNSQSQLEILQSEVAGAHQLVIENLESIVKRGNSLNQMEDTSVEILQDTKALLQTSKELDLQAFWRKNMTYIIAAAVAILFLYILFH